ncbi:diguanylate cyclase [Neobacillus terrae]|uniref:GGDEF domain-containing response regulator n=1 Tax=Neobacillus terrae TaxID=3034837 RepID=UPI001FB0ACC6|nr:diguanylate cyclase [Neobacillus terrae]
MDFNKYKNMLFKKIKDQISAWFETQDQKPISNRDVYLFLHSIKGTSGTLQLGGLFQVASCLMDKIEEDSEKDWQTSDLWDFLYELISLAYEYENFEENGQENKYTNEENAPLIQIIDDDISMLILLKDALEEQGWMVITSTKPEKAISQYYDFHPDCVLIDIHLPNKSGFEVIERLQKQNARQFVPFIMMSILSDRATRMKAFKLGADDFVEKPIDIEELSVRLDRHLQRKRMFDQSALMDDMTMLYNRQFFRTVFERNISELKRNSSTFSIAVLDLDHFKNINDTFGHLAGDRVLTSFAQFLKEHTRNADSVFRYGGEEFVILFERTENLSAVEIVNRILEKFTDKIFDEKGQDFNVTFSAGIFSVDSDSIALETAFHAADQALYKAKEKGRARVESANQFDTDFSKKPLYISVIDDDSIIRTMLRKILESMDFQYYELDIKVFEDGPSFFETKRLEEKGEHFLILDGIMPVMDGIEVLDQVKKSKQNSHVLMLTGRKGDYDIARALKLGADDYLTKPFSITELQARIQRLIQRME